MLIVKRYGKHPAQLGEALCAHLFIEVNDDLSITMGVKLMAAGFEFAAQLREVVYLAIEDDPNALVFVVNGLVAAREIDNAEPPHAQAHRPASVNSLVVRPAMDDRLAHAVDLLRLGLLVGAPHQSCYPAHGVTPVAMLESGRFGAGIFINDCITNEFISNGFFINASMPAYRFLPWSPRNGSTWSF